MPNVQCTISISEVDGRLDISASIPDDAEKTIAGELAKLLLAEATHIMNKSLGVDQRPEIVRTN